MNILFVGDICSRPGRNAAKKVVPELIKQFDIDFCVMNIENASSGKGVTPENYEDLKALPVDVFTSGNHIFAKRDIVSVLENKKELLLRPANFPAGTPGRGVWQGEVGSTKVAVVNLLGRTFMGQEVDDPFRAADFILKDLDGHLTIVDFHAEATSEKRALGFYLDGKVGAVIGTHTHVPTADAQILPKGTAYITDVGYVGPLDSVLGVDKEIIIHNFLTMPQTEHEIAKGDAEFNAVIMKSIGTKITSITHLRQIVENSP